MQGPLMTDPFVSPLLMLVCGLGTVLVVGVIAYVALRAFAAPKRDDPGTARVLLDRRLAIGEIDLDEYYERESALRHSELPQRRGRRRV
jgi:uncharacterized membrane protein